MNQANGSHRSSGQKLSTGSSPSSTRGSRLEELFLLQIRTLEVPEPIREFRFSPPRRFRFDYAWPDRMLAVELEGGTWTRGRHTRGAGFAKDCEKYSMAAILGWRIVRATADQVYSGEALKWTMAALEYRPENNHVGS